MFILQWQNKQAPEKLPSLSGASKVRRVTEWTDGHLCAPFCFLNKISRKHNLPRTCVSIGDPYNSSLPI